MSRFLSCLATALVATTPAVCLAHGGGTDAAGCHFESATGTRHCHGGASAGGGVSWPSYPVQVPGYGSSPGSSTKQNLNIRIAPGYKPAKAAHTTAKAVSGPASLVSVGDGDTIRVTTKDGKKATIRLACIDAPETAQGDSGALATHYLQQLLASGPVEIRSQTVDRYGRTVAEGYAGGRNVNLQMVASGNAYAYRQYLSGCDQAAYLGAESQAEQQRLGVWRWGGDGQRPWDFRNNR